MSERASYVLTIDGLPYYAATAQCPVITSWGSTDDQPRGAAILRGALGSTQFAWDERVDASMGGLEVGGLTFALHDVQPTSGIASGRRWLTWLATREPGAVTSAIVAASFTAAATTFDLTSSSVGAVSASIPGVLWVDGEAILCASLSTNTVTVDTNGRGYYGSRARPHTVDEQLGIYPEAWVAPPWSVYRRVVLWRVSSAGVATAIWRGYSNRAPRLAKDGASYEFQCESAWTVERQRALGDVTAGTRVRGYNAAGVQLSVVDNSGGWVGAGNMSSWLPRYGYGLVEDGIDPLLTQIRTQLRANILSYSAGTFRPTNAVVNLSRVGNSATAKVLIESNDANRPLLLNALVMGESFESAPATQAVIDLGVVRTPTGQRFELTFTLPEIACVIASPAYGRGQRVPITTIEGLPTSAASAEVTSVGAHRTSVQQALVADYDDDLRFVVLQPYVAADDAAGSYGTATGGTSTTLVDSGQSWDTDEWAGLEVRFTAGTGAGGSSIITSNTATTLTLETSGTAPDTTTRYAILGPIRGPAARGTCLFLSKTTGRARPPVTGVRGLTGTAGSPYGANVTLIDRPLDLLLSHVVRTTHWAYGAQALVESSLVNSGVDPRNFDWASLDDLVTSTEGETTDRVWVVDGTTTLGKLLTPTLTAEGCVPTVREQARISLNAVRWPSPTQTVAATFGANSFAAGSRCDWTALPESVVNVVKLETETFELTVRDTRSIGRYGAAGEREVKLEGLRPGSAAATDPRLTASRLLSRLIQTWGDPVARVRWTVPLTLGESVYCGDVVSLTAPTVPDGEGGHGLTSARVFIVARSIDTGAHTIAFDGLAFPLAYAYAPAVRVASISADTLTAASDYVLSGSLDSTDYAGAGGTDLGVSKFSAGDKVKLILRDVTSVGEYAATVLGVDDAMGTIQLTASVPTSPTDWPLLATTGWLDLVFDGYTTSGIQAAQKDYAVVGGGSADYGLIDSTDPTRRWAP